MKYEHPALEYTEQNNFSGFIVATGHFEVCPSCGGAGVHERRDIDISQLIDNMKEDGDDEGIEQYFKGIYDVKCTECKGKNVIMVPNLPEWAEKAIEEWRESERDYRREVEAERRVGA